MTCRPALMLALTLALVSPALRPAGAQPLDTGTLQDRCAGAGPEARAFCAGYVAGLLDLLLGFQTLTGRRSICPPEGLPTAELQGLILRVLEQSPRGQAPNAALMLGQVLAQSFPCEAPAAPE